MKSFWLSHWTTLGGVALLALAGTISLCTWTPGCLLNAAPADSTVPEKPTTPARDLSLRGETMLRVPAEPRIEHVDTADFATKVLRAELPVLVDFYADWCGPCRALSPVLEEFARENPGAKVVKINVDENPELAARYRVDAIPRLMVFKDGRATATHSGLANKARLTALLQR